MAAKECANDKMFQFRNDLLLEWAWKKLLPIDKKI